MESPLKRKPLRNPGQSLDERLDALVNDKALGYVLMPMVLWLVAGLEWLAKALHPPRMPLFYAAAAAVLSAWSAWKLRRIFKEARWIKLGRDGEREVGQLLEEIRSQGARVIHDVQTGRSNIDHVIISPKGVFAVETKTWSKPTGDSRISVRDGVIYRGSVPCARDVIGQVQGEAGWLRDFLKEYTGQSYFVHPVVVFPGWYVNEPTEAAQKASAWVLAPKRLLGYLAHEPERLRPDQVSTAAAQLVEWVRRSG